MAGMNNGGLRGGNGRRGYRPMAEINVTPFVDVMLVLLIVFMVTAPLLTVGVPVDLPRTEAQIFIRGDRALLYGRIMEVMGAINAAGFQRVSLVAELPQEPAS